MNNELAIVITIIGAFLSVFTVWIYLNKRINQTNMRITTIDKEIGGNIAMMSKSISNLEADIRELKTDVRWIKKMMEGK